MARHPTRYNLPMARLGRWTHATLTLLWFPLGVLAVLACALFTL
jgi:hypothetical protein